MQAELLLLRVLGFDLRSSLPWQYLPRYLERALADITNVAEDYETWGKEEREEYGVVTFMETGIGKACRVKAIEACKNYQLANLFPARAVALACVYVSMEERRMEAPENAAKWVERIASGKVDAEDFAAVCDELRKLRWQTEQE